MTMTVDHTAIPGSVQAERLHAAFDATTIKWNDRAASLAAFKEGRELTFNEDGEPVSEYDGEELPLAEALTRFAYDNRMHVDARTLPRISASGARAASDCKANYSSAESKAEYISKFGFDKWSALPLNAAAETKEITHREDVYELSIEERAALYGKHGPDWIGTLPSRPKADPLEAAREKHIYRIRPR